ncbi:beta-glucuronidase AbsR1 [Streptosporangium sp. CA-135522]|uniref:beta-glucuronidase AbsR1 n=1 Tax=Streptosporangium sp. CA-135522 TaxID=3240072 RepID=UPI003D8AD0DF
MNIRYCAIPPQPPPPLPAGLEADRLNAIIATRFTWLNGTVLHYYFFDRESDGSVITIPEDGTERWVSWVGGKDQQDVVRESFQAWKDLGIGLEFAEVTDRVEAELRIGFQRGGGSYSKVGRSALAVGTDQRTMNFGWDLTPPDQRSTALHEIGHALGMVHEHQSPFAGIVWDEEAVYADLAGPPNFWPPEKTFHNIIRKHDPSEVNGSAWDPQSIMEYPFNPGLILEPEKYRAGLFPPGTISEADAVFARRWYPSPKDAEPLRLVPFRSVPLGLKAGAQADFVIAPEATRDYTVATFGESDTVLVLFEEIDGEPRYLTGEDDGGRPDNAFLTAHLVKGRHYIVRVRLHSSWGPGQTAVMCW